MNKNLKLRNLLTLLMFVCASWMTAQINVSGVVNAYYPVNSIAGSTVNVGAGSGAAHSLAVGDRVLLIQMTGSTDINGGKFEMAWVAGVAGGSITLDAVERSYTTSDKVQLVWVPWDASGITVTANSTAMDWNGSTGGVIALQTPGTLTLSGALSANGAGFCQGDVTITGSDVYYGGGGGAAVFSGGGGGGGYGSAGAGSADGSPGSGVNGGTVPPLSGAGYGGGGGGGAGVGAAGSGGAGGPHSGAGGGGAGYAGGGCGGEASDNCSNDGYGGEGHIGGSGDTDGSVVSGVCGGGYTPTGGGGGGSRYVGGGGGGYSAGGKSGSNGGAAGGTGGAGGGIAGSTYHSFLDCPLAQAGICTDPRLWMGGAGGGRTDICGGGIIFVHGSTIAANNRTLSVNGDDGIPIGGASSAGGTGGGGAGLIAVHTQFINSGLLNLCVHGGDGGKSSGDASHGGGGGGAGGAGVIWVNDPLGAYSDNGSGQPSVVANIAFCGLGGVSSTPTPNPKNAGFTGVGGCAGDKEEVVNDNCGIFEACSGSITGKVTEDIDNDDDGDDPISGVTMMLTDKAGNQVIDSNGDIVANVLTDANGEYEFLNLDEGDYIVMEVQPNPYFDVRDQDFSVDDPTDAADAQFKDNKICVELSLGEVDGDNDFIEERVGTICGNVSEDYTEDDLADQAIAGVTIKLTYANGTPALDINGLIKDVLTDANGDYCFTNLPPSDYKLTEVQPVGFNDVSDDDASNDDATDSSDGNKTDSMIPVRLAPGEDDTENDFVEKRVGKLSGYVHEDIDNDDVANTPISGVTIKLLTKAGAPATDILGVAQTITTDASGYYEFDRLLPGDYNVMEVHPNGYFSVWDEDESDEDSFDSADANKGDDMICGKVEASEHDEDNNFLEERVGSISGDVTEDRDNDGDGDVPIEGIEFMLTDKSGNAVTDVSGNTIGSAFSDANGEYSFGDLVLGDYIVMEIQPIIYQDVSEEDESDDDGTDAADASKMDNKICVELAYAEDDEDNNFIEKSLGKISGYVWEDTQNDDVEDIPISGVTIKLLNADQTPANDAEGVLQVTTTDANGFYEFDLLLPLRDYIVMEVQPADYYNVWDEDESDEDVHDTNDDRDLLDDMILVTLNPTEEDKDNNFVEEQVGTICGKVTEDIDADDVGDLIIEGVVMTLFYADGSPALDQEGVAVASVLTDAEGKYCFEFLPPDNYKVMESQPLTYNDVIEEDETAEDATDNGDADKNDNMIPVKLTPGEDDEDNNFVEKRVGKISGYVHEDIMNDDIPNIPLEGVTIKLIDSNGNPAVDVLGVLQTTTTDASGYYIFDQLIPGDYVSMEVQPEPGELYSVWDEDNSDEDAYDTNDAFKQNDMIESTVEPSEHDENNDFLEERFGKITGYVFEDIDNNDTPDQPIEDVVLTLLDSDGNPAVDGLGNPVENVYTDGSGYYQFCLLVEDNYIVVESQPEDYYDVWEEDTSDDDSLDPTDVTRNDDRIEVYVSYDEEDNNNDFVEELVGTISGYVKEDINNDDIGDDPISFVTMKLLGENGLAAVDQMGNIVPNELTDADGYYLFETLPAGTYTVMEVQPADLYDVWDEDQSDDDALDPTDVNVGNPTVDPTDDRRGDDMIPVELGPGEDDEDNDFVEERLGSISGTFAKQVVTIDDEGTPITFYVPMTGVTVTLLDENGAVIATTLTDGNGDYKFDLLATDKYTVISPAAPAGCEDVRDQDESILADDQDGGDDPKDNRVPVDLGPGEDDEDNDFIDAEKMNIGNYVWYDEQENGRQDAGSTGVEGVEIDLIVPGTDGIFGTPDDVVVMTETTNAFGSYLFEDVCSGTYRIFYDPTTLPSGYLFTSKDTGFTDEDDNDANLSGFGDIFTLVPGQMDDLSFDAGIYENEPCASWEQAVPNSVLGVGIVVTPETISNQNDIVSVTVVVVNLGDEPLTNIVLEEKESLFSGIPMAQTLTTNFAGDPNFNNQLDPGEIWFYTGAKTYDYSNGDAFILSVAATADHECGSEVGAAADLLFSQGVNMDVGFVQECANPGDKVDVTLTTRLLVDEDAALDPGTITIYAGGTPITLQLPKTRWEARDLLITVSNLNDGLEFNPFDPPAGLMMTNFCEQGGVDAGRNFGDVDLGPVLDESEPIETVRLIDDGCTLEDPNDILCQYPDWQFCYCFTVPEDFVASEYEITATDDFAIWRADENPAGSDQFTDFVDLSASAATGGTETAGIVIKQSIVPVALKRFEAIKSGKTAMLNWTTASEINNSHYVIERSENGRDYESIGQVAGSGTSLEENSYSYVDGSPLSGLNYYRLSQVDTDGRQNRTESKILDFSYVAGSANVSVFPNPVIDYMVIESTISEALTVEMYTMDGKRVMSQSVNAGTEIEMSDYAKGQYTIVVTDSYNYKLLTKQLTVIK